MGCITILMLAVGLSMDAFAVSVCKGLAMQKMKWKNAAIVGLWFGGFQGLMPLIGYLLGVQFENYINAIAPWIAFGLLSVIGVNMIKESFDQEETKETDTLHWKEMFLLAVATSIDALAVGITFACVPVNIISSAKSIVNTLLACAMIALTTDLLSIIGVKVGTVFGNKYKSKAEFAGGAILIALGIKILLEDF